MTQPEPYYSGQTLTEALKPVFDLKTLTERQDGIDELIDLLARKVASLNAEVIELAKKVMELEQKSAAASRSGIYK